jgi:hypothetical protein
MLANPFSGSEQQLLLFEGLTDRDDGGAVFLFEFAESASVHNPSNNVPHVKCLPNIRSYDTMKFGRVV